MNWMGGHLAQFKRKRVSKKAEERRRIEEYIAKRQKKEIMSGVHDFNRQETSSSTEPFINQQNLNSKTGDFFTSANFEPRDTFKQSVDPALLANPWAGIDPNFLKPKVFPSYLKNTPKLYFDAAEGNFTTKPAASVISPIRSTSQNEFNFNDKINVPEFSSPFEDYGPVLPPVSSGYPSQVLWKSFLLQFWTKTIYFSQYSTQTSSYRANDHTFSFNESVSETSTSSIAPIDKSNHVSSSNNDTTEESFSKSASKKNINFVTSASKLPNQWDFEEEDAEDFVLFEY